MADNYQSYLANPNVRALLDTIRWAEGTAGADGYRTQFTGTTFNDLSRHPRQIRSSSGLSSDAAGAYQFLSTTWDGVAKELGLRDFSPSSQDLAALRLIERRGVNLGEVAARGLQADTFHKLAKEWASLPTRETGTSAYGQGGKKIGELLSYATSRRGAPQVPSGSGAAGNSIASSPVNPAPLDTGIAGAAPAMPKIPGLGTTLIDSLRGPSITAAPAAPTAAAAGGNLPVSGLLGNRMAGPGLKSGMDGLAELLVLAATGKDPEALASQSDSFAQVSVPSLTPKVPESGQTTTGTPRTGAPNAGAPVANAPQRSGRMVGIVDLGKMIQGTGLRVGEHPAFGKVGGHSANSLHYSGRALDITDWQDPDESEASWKPRKAWMGQQLQQLLAGTDAEVFSPHNDPAGHGSHIHLGLPSGGLDSNLAQGILAIRQQALQKFPLRWRG